MKKSSQKDSANCRKRDETVYDSENEVFPDSKRKRTRLEMQKEKKEIINDKSFVDHYMKEFVYQISSDKLQSRKISKRIFRCHMCMDFLPAISSITDEHFEICDYISFYLKTPHLNSLAEIPGKEDKICGFCGFSCKLLAEIEGHLFKDHEQIPISWNRTRKNCIQCHMCKERVPTLNALYHHTIIHKMKYKHAPITCQTLDEDNQVICGICQETESFQGENYYQSKYVKHLRVAHDVKISLENVCQLCGHLNENIDDLSRHLADNHNASSQNLLNLFNQKVYKCHLCSDPFFYSFLSGIYYHFESKHDKNMIHFTLNTCPVCENFFNNRRSIQYHLERIHKINVTFFCPICHQNGFLSRQETINHIKDVHKKPFEINRFKEEDEENLTIKEFILKRSFTRP